MNEYINFEFWKEIDNEQKEKEKKRIEKEKWKKDMEGKFLTAMSKLEDLKRKVEILEKERIENKKLEQKEEIKEIVRKEIEKLKVSKEKSVRKEEERVDERKEMEERKERVEKWIKDKRIKDYGEEKEMNWKETVLIISRGKKASQREDLEDWIKGKLRTRLIKIEKDVENKEAAKVFFRGKIDRNEIWERKEELKEKYDLLIDEWMSFEERKRRFERMKELKKRVLELEYKFSK